MGEESIGLTKIRWRSYQYAYGKKDNIERSPVARVKGSRGRCMCRFYDMRCLLLYVEYVGDICSEANTTRKHRYDCVVMVLIDVSMVLRHCVKQKKDYVGVLHCWVSCLFLVRRVVVRRYVARCRQRTMCLVCVDANR